MTKEELVILIKADPTLYKKAMAEAIGATAKFSGAVNSMIGNVAANAITKVASEIGTFIQGSFAAYKEQEQNQAKLTAVLASTKGAAGLTADELNRMAGEMSKLNAVDDDAITGAQALLLTFTKISKDIFPETTQTVLNMSAALGQDLKSSSIQLGKALNDPIKGITALSRVGVSFNDTQKKQIQYLQESGDLMGAQKIILAELATEFGGASESIANTTSGRIEAFKIQIGNIQEGIGKKLMEILDFLLTNQEAVVKAIVVGLGVIGTAWAVVNAAAIKSAIAVTIATGGLNLILPAIIAATTALGFMFVKMKSESDQAAESFDTLSARYLQLKKSASLNAVEQQVLDETIKKLNTNFPKLIKGVDLTKATFDKAKTAIEGARLELKKFQDDQVKQKVLEESNQKIIDSTAERIKLTAELASAQAKLSYAQSLDKDDDQRSALIWEANAKIKTLKKDIEAYTGIIRLASLEQFILNAELAKTSKIDAAPAGSSPAAVAVKNTGVADAEAEARRIIAYSELTSAQKIADLKRQINAAEAGSDEQKKLQKELTDFIVAENKRQVEAERAKNKELYDAEIQRQDEAIKAFEEYGKEYYADLQTLSDLEIELQNRTNQQKYDLAKAELEAFRGNDAEKLKLEIALARATVDLNKEKNDKIAEDDKKLKEAKKQQLADMQSIWSRMNSDMWDSSRTLTQKLLDGIKDYAQFVTLELGKMLIEWAMTEEGKTVATEAGTGARIALAVGAFIAVSAKMLAEGALWLAVETSKTAYSAAGYLARQGMALANFLYESALTMKSIALTLWEIYLKTFAFSGPLAPILAGAAVLGSIVVVKEAVKAVAFAQGGEFEQNQRGFIEGIPGGEIIAPKNTFMDVITNVIPSIVMNSGGGSQIDYDRLALAMSRVQLNPILNVDARRLSEVNDLGLAKRNVLVSQ